MCICNGLIKYEHSAFFIITTNYLSNDKRILHSDCKITRTIFTLVITIMMSFYHLESIKVVHNVNELRKGYEETTTTDFI